MNLRAQIKTITLPPLVIANGEIPRCEIIVRLPPRWVKFITGWDVDIEEAISTVVCDPWRWEQAGKVELCRDFAALWHGGHPFTSSVSGLGDVAIPHNWQGGGVKARFPLRRDVLECLHAAAALVNRHPHEVLAKILTRTLPLIAGRPLPKVRRKPEPGKIIPFPTANA